ncbi:MAG: flagellar biosynthetic protein FliR [Hyphomicrobium sp.]
MPITDATILAVFMIFCRVGSALMLLPGLSAQQIPIRIRLMAAFACTLALAPLLVPDLGPKMENASSTDHILMIMSEVAVGLMIGMLGRFFFVALEFFGAAASTFLGLGGTPGIPLHDGEVTSLLGSLISVTAIFMIFSTELHLEMIRALLASYRVIDVASFFDVGAALRHLVSVASKAFLIAVQLCGPFIIYSIVVNLLFGLANKFMPQVPIYFVSIPFIILGGFGIFVLAGPHMLNLFMQAYAQWMITGTP